MADNGGPWEREVLERIALAGIKEQRASRRWGIFFKLLAFAYVTTLLLFTVDFLSALNLLELKFRCS